MESFADATTNAPVRAIEVPEGGTRVLRLKRPGPGVDVTFASSDPAVASLFTVTHLNHSKESYIENHEDVLGDSSAVDQLGFIFFQIVGIKTGTAELTARIKGRPIYYDPYGLSVTVSVKENSKRFTIAVGHPIPFQRLWENHPYKKNPTPHKLCGASWVVGECMVRFCTMMKDSGIDLAWLHSSQSKCGRGKGHEHHFINPYDFEKIRHVKDAYVWESSALQPEPMPGIAALSFIKYRWKGVILFRNYFNTIKKGHDMQGGHIDLWNGSLMGNSLIHPSESAFYRSSRIVFWPIESY